MNNNSGNMELPISDRKNILRIGGIAALLTVAVAFGEMLITFLPGGNEQVETVIDWFTQLQSNWFMGLRNLGLLNIIMFTLGIPMYFALYVAHRKVNKTFAALVMIISFIGVAIFFATNRAFSMLELSKQYAGAVTDSERSGFLAAGQAMLSVGKSHSPGTFICFFLGELSGILMSLVILKGKIFNKATALIGIIGFSLLLLFEVFTSFVPALKEIGMFLAMGGGALNVVWLILLGIGFLKLTKKET
jgi:hypothetical protein